jgi:hypothetical protein
MIAPMYAQRAAWRNARTAAALLVAALVGPALVAAETAPPSPARLVGTYRYAESERHGRALIEKAFAPAIEELDLVTRTVARRKLARTNALSHTIVIAAPGAEIAVEYVGEKTVRVASRPGVATKVKAPNGNEVTLTQRVEEGALVQVFVGPKGTTTNRLSLSDGDRVLDYHSAIRGKEISTPIDIRLTYRRQ